MSDENIETGLDIYEVEYTYAALGRKHLTSVYVVATSMNRATNMVNEWLRYRPSQPDSHQVISVKLLDEKVLVEKL